MKRILIISELHAGGVERVNTLISEYINKDEFEVLILSIKGVGKDLIKNINFISLDSKNGRSAFFRIIKEIKKYKPDLILTNKHTDTICSLIYTRLINRKSKSVFSLHSVYSSVFHYKKKRAIILQHYVPKILNLYGWCDGVIFISNGIKQDFKKYYYIKEEREFIINNPVLENRKSAIRNKMIGEKVKLITVGRLSREKNQRFLIDVVKELNNMNVASELSIVGKGVLLDELKQYASSILIGQNINFIGYTDNVNEELIKHDIFVLSSEYESFGNVIVEAMAAKLPVVSTDCFCGPREIIGNNEFGFLVGENNVEEFCKSIISVINDYPNEIVEKAYIEVERYEVKSAVKLYENMFRSLLYGEISV